MSLTLLSAEKALQQLDAFDTIIDARSEAEFEEDHLPQACNWPTLSNEERRVVGTMYKQIDAFEAKKRGAAMAARNISAHIEREVIDKPKDWKPLAYCWRGGKRSGALSLVLDQIGFRVTLLEGGYKAFRAALLLDMAHRVAPLQWRVICGTTGSGKTRLLHALSSVGAQVLDLEGLARHRSSVLGAIPGVEQPSQKHFDTLVWNALRHLDPNRPVFIESESKKVGNVAVPDALVQAIRAAPCLSLSLCDDERVALLMEDYDYFVQRSEAFCDRLDALTEIRGKGVVQAWKDQIHSGHTPAVVRELLVQHYDPVYVQSMTRNFTQFANAPIIAPANRSHEAMLELAQRLVATHS